MNCRELALVSTAAVFGALASALTCRFFFSNPKRQSAKLDLSKNGVVSGNAVLSSVLTLQSAKAERFKDPNRQVGACLVSENGVILEIQNWGSFGDKTLYVTMFPCNECAKIIIQSGVAEVVYFVEKRSNNPDVSDIASHKLPSLAGVEVGKHQPYNKLVNGSSCSR